MRSLRIFLLILLMLVPAVTLFHRDDTGKWDTQRSAMAAPDEFSYLLMAQHFLHGGGLSLKTALGRDTFYPPGYPLFLAAWAKLLWHGELTNFAAHTLNATLLATDILLVYILLRRLTPEPLALLITALFATNWHVLETSLLVMSEPAFMLATFAWLLISVRRPRWHESVPLAALMALLATAAWSIRGAGIVCVAVTALYPLLVWTTQYLRARLTPQQNVPRATRLTARLFPMLLILLVPLLYQLVLLHFSREKSLASSDDSGNGYVHQLLNGLNTNLPRMIVDHLYDYASSFVPWPRESPDSYFRAHVGLLIAALALMGYLWRVVPLVLPARKKSPHAAPPLSIDAPVAPAADKALADATRATKMPVPRSLADATGSVLRAARARHMLELYILLYAGLYLVWPFDFTRFWSPILPFMLAYAADFAIRFSCPRFNLSKQAGTYALLALLLLLSVEEVCLQLGNYARRLNYVSDAIAASAHTITQQSPDPRNAIIVVMGADEHFALGWYLTLESQRQGTGGSLAGGYTIRTGMPHDPKRGGRPEHTDDLLIRTLDEIRTAPDKKVFFFSYFPEVNTDTRDTIASLAKQSGNESVFTKIYEKFAVAQLWQFQNRPAPARTP